MTDQTEEDRRETRARNVLYMHVPIQAPGQPITFCVCGWRTPTEYGWPEHVARYLRNEGCFA